MRIGYLTVPSGKLASQPNQYGLNVVANAAVSSGFDVKLATPADDLSSFDVLMVGLYWWEHLLNFIRLVSRSGIRRGRKPVVIVGGQNACLNPLPISGLIDYAVAVDGEAVIGRLLSAIERGDREPDLPGVWWPGKKEPSTAVSVEELVYFPHIQFDGNLDPFSDAPVKSVVPVSFVEIARGCPHHCRFCALSSLKPYRELGYPEIDRAIRKSRARQMRVFAPERSAHSRFSDIEKCIRDAKRINVSVDIRLESIKDLPVVGGVQFGIEGLSERLRHAVGKRLTRDQMVEYVGLVHSTPTHHGKPHMGCNAYLIGGLPGERAEDYEEFSGDLRALNAVLPPGFALKLIINWFIPQPFTALQFAPVDPVAPWRKPAWFDVAHGANRNAFSYKIKQMQSLPSASKWALGVLVTRATEENFPLIKAMALDPRARKLVDSGDFDGMMRLCERGGMPESRLLGELPTSELLPWERVWSHPRGQPDYTRRQWARYNEIAGVSHARSQDP